MRIPMRFFLSLILLHVTCIFGNMDKLWWRHTSIYQIMIPTFKDSDGDGIGDIKGIISKLDHFVDLGIETIYLNPFYESPMIDTGYDISNYYEIHPQVGTMADFEELIREMKIRGMKLIIDLVINHSSDLHEWFEKSVQKINPYTNYYIWADPKGFNETTLEPIPPNDWYSIFGGSAWTWNDRRGQFYYRVFMPQQPDLNLRNQQVKNLAKNIIKFWLDKGVAGFRVDAPVCYIEGENVEKDSQFSLEESIQVLQEFRSYLDEYNKQKGDFERIFIPESRPGWELYFHVLKQYRGTEDHPGTHLVTNYFFEEITYELHPVRIHEYLQIYKMYFPQDEYPTAWVSQSHDSNRIANRIKPEYNDIFTIITTLLPGVVIIYYGQEIEMRVGYVTSDQIQDISGKGTRDPTRLIMQWDNTTNAGFSNNTWTYLPSNTDYYERNVKNQKYKTKSNYHLLKTLLKLRQTDTFKYGDFDSTSYGNDAFIFWRSHGNRRTWVVINLKNSSIRLNLSFLIPSTTGYLKMAATSVNSEYNEGDEIPNNPWSQFSMRPLSCIVFDTDLLF